MDNITFQASKIKTYISSLNSMAESIKNYRENLNNHWQASEVADINRAIAEILKSITSLNSILQTLDSDINEIVQKEQV